MERTYKDDDGAFHCWECYESAGGSIILCNLHAAAPDLLAALKKATKLIENDCEGHPPVSPGELFMQMELVAKEARVAIAKAEGE